MGRSVDDPARLDLLLIDDSAVNMARTNVQNGEMIVFQVGGSLRWGSTRPLALQMEGRRVRE